MSADIEAPPEGSPAIPRDPGLLALVAVVLRQATTIAAVTAASLVGALAFTYLSTPRYVAGTVLVPAADVQSRTQLLLSQLPAGVAGFLGTGGGSSDRLVVALVRSRSLSDTLAARLGSTPSREFAVRLALAKGTRVQRNPDGTIVVEVRAPDPQLSAQIANAIPREINAMLSRIGAQTASTKQQFILRQLDGARERLLATEQRLQDFQEKSAAPDPTEQARQSIQAAAQIQQRIYEEELVVARLRRVSTPDNPALRSAEAELEGRRAQLRRLTSGTAGPGSVFMPLDEGPSLKVASARFLREYETEEKIFEALAAAAAEAQIDANNNLPVLGVLDSAVVPPGPTRQVPTVLAMALVLGVAAGVVLAFARDAMARVERTPETEEFFTAWEELRRRLGRGRASTGRT